MGKLKLSLRDRFAGLDEYLEEEDFIDNNLDSSKFSPCPLCNGNGIPMGKLGRAMHYRCRHCGYNFSNVAK